MPPTTSIPGTSSEPHAPEIFPEARLRCLYEFASFRVDPANRQLSEDGKDIPLPGRVFDVLLLLLDRAGDLVTKEEMLAAVWRDSFVEEANLTVAVSSLRRALREDPHDRRYIQTVARRGYRFIAEVRQIAPVARPLRVVPAVAPASEEPSLQPAEPQPPVTAPADTAAIAPVIETTVATSPGWRQTAFLAAFTLVLTTLVAGCWYLLKPRSPLHSLAVLPITLDPASSWQGAAAPDEVALLGMTDALISRLEPQLIVRPTSSVLRYSAATTLDPVAAGREQGVDAVLTGSIGTSRSEATLHLRLVRVRDGLVLWQNQFSAPWNNLARLQQTAADAAARQLKGLGASSSPGAPAPQPRTNDRAYQLYQRGRYFWNRRTVDGLRKASEYFKQAIDADPNYAPAYAGLADSYALLASFSVEPGSAANADARSAALSAIQLDPTLAEPHASLGMIYFFTDWNLPAAEREFLRAIQLNPNYATAHHWYALDLAAMGRMPQALYEIQLAQKLDPLSLIIGTNVGWIEYLGRHNEEATKALQTVLELDPHFARARTRLGMVQVAQGRYNEAIANFNAVLTGEAEEKDGRDPYVEGLLGEAQALNGDTVAARRTLAELNAASGRYVPPISRALVLAGMRRKAEAIGQLSAAVQDHSTSMVYALVDPSLDPLRQEPAFAALLKQSGLLAAAGTH